MQPTTEEALESLYEKLPTIANSANIPVKLDSKPKGDDSPGNKESRPEDSGNIIINRHQKHFDHYKKPKETKQ